MVWMTTARSMGKYYRIDARSVTRYRSVVDEPRGRQPKKQISVEPRLAIAFRHVARREGKQLSALFREMFSQWLQKRRKKYPEVELEDE